MSEVYGTLASVMKHAATEASLADMGTLNGRGKLAGGAVAVSRS